MNRYFIIIIAWLILIWASIAVSFPEMSRHGYNACSSCHVSPSGGGVLTSYGRGISESALSTWQLERESSYFVTYPDWVDLGGDVRLISLAHEKVKSIFLMQSDFEAAVHVRDFTIVGSAGFYFITLPAIAEDFSILEQRRNYVLWRPSQYFSLRLGRFFPAYGVMTSDHTLISRWKLGFGQGRESFNAEASLNSAYGQLFFTLITGPSVGITGSNDGYRGNLDPLGWIARLSVFTSKKSNSGVSLLRHDGRSAYGAFINLGINDAWYLLGQTDRVFDGPKPSNVFSLKSGYEFWRGAHVVGTYERDSNIMEGYRAALQWFPRPHFEFLVEYGYQLKPFSSEQKLFFLAHFYF